MTISEHRKSIARHLAGQFGGRPTIVSYATEDKAHEVGILVAADCPEPGQSSIASIGLSEHPLIRDGKEFPARVELVAAARDSKSMLARALSTACFTIIRSMGFVAPGVVIRDVFGHRAKGRVKHLLCASPFVWDPPLVSQTFDGMRVAWLQVIPITDGEAALAEAVGARALEDALEAQRADLSDLGRGEIQLPAAKPVAGKPDRPRSSKLGPLVSIDGRWTIALPAGCKRRTEDGAVVFWRAGLTIWSVVAPSSEPPQLRVDDYLAESTASRTGEGRDRVGELHRAWYRAAGDGTDAKRPSLNAIVAGADSSLIISFYFDDEEAAPLCGKILDTISPSGKVPTS